MYNLQLNNRFGNLEFEDENEENVENKKAAEVKETKRETAKKQPGKGNTASTQPPRLAAASDKPPARNQPRPFSAQAPQEKAVPQNDNRQRPTRGGNAQQSGFGGRNAGGPPAFSNSNVGNRQGGGRMNSGFENRGKREFERKSGSEKTGVRATDKRDGSGAHNWGNSIKDFTTETFAPPADIEAEGEKKLSDDKVTGENAGDASENAGAPDEPQETQNISLDEYLSRIEKAKSAMPVLQLRKAGEGEGAFNGVKLGKKLQKNKSDQEEMVKIVEERVSGRTKNILEVEFPSIASRGRGGGRRGGGGRGSHGGGRGRDFQGAALPNISDEQAFPALQQ